MSNTGEQPEQNIEKTHIGQADSSLPDDSYRISSVITPPKPKNYSKKLPEARSIQVIDFFSGCGGVSFGFQSTRQSHIEFDVLGGIDIDEDALKTYALNINAPGLVCDIREIEKKPEMLLDLIPEFDPQKRPFVFAGCPPCQGFSPHRKKDDVDDPRNNLVPTFAKICKHFEPDIIFMENVPQIITGKYKEYYERGSKILKNTGYTLNEKVIDFRKYGVPQKRKRAIILGEKNNIIDFPNPIYDQDNPRTVRDAISHLPEIEAGEIHEWDQWHRAPDHTERILKRIKATPTDGGDRRDLNENEQLDCHSKLDSSESTGFTDVYGRLRWDEASVTITAKSSTPSCGRFLHPEQHRNISVREAAILQSFPQYYEFCGNFAHQYRQIGEAVPPLFMRFVAWKILKNINDSRTSASLIDSWRKKSKKKSELTFVDCFCGAGGLSIGMENAGLQACYSFDNNDDCIKTYNHNLTSVAEKYDIRDDGVSEKISTKATDDKFLLVGGPPCQGFSQQRRGDDEDERNNLVIEYVKLLEKVKHLPVAFVLENVTYLDSPRGKEVFSEAKRILHSYDYEIFRHDLNSANYGVPQLRERIILVAIKEDYSSFYEGPAEMTPKRWPTIGEFLSRVPSPNENYGRLDFDIPNHSPSNESTKNKRRIAFVDMGCGRMAIPEELQLNCHKDYSGHLDVYGRLDWFSQARTITTGFDSFSRGEYGHPFEHRSITHREGAILQGFPIDHKFFGNKDSVRNQIGNAVPPTMGYAIGKAIKDCFEKSTDRKRATVDKGKL